jgi:hypothetical protein
VQNTDKIRKRPRKGTTPKSHTGWLWLSPTEDPKKQQRSHFRTVLINIENTKKKPEIFITPRYAQIPGHARTVLKKRKSRALPVVAAWGQPSKRNAHLVYWTRKPDWNLSVHKWYRDGGGVQVEHDPPLPPLKSICAPHKCTPLILQDGWLVTIPKDFQES